MKRQSEEAPKASRKKAKRTTIARTPNEAEEAGSESRESLRMEPSMNQSTTEPSQTRRTDIPPSVSSLLHPPSSSQLAPLLGNFRNSSDILAQHLLTTGASTVASPSPPSIVGNLSLPQQSISNLHLQLPRISIVPPTTSLTATNPLAHQIILDPVIRRLAGSSLSAEDQLQQLLGMNSLSIQGIDPAQQSMIDRLSLASLHAGWGLATGQPWATAGALSASAGLGSAVPSLSQTSISTQSDLLSVDAIPLSLPTDKSNLSEYQCLVREQIQLFSASRADVESSAQGRNRPIIEKQVGIRCRHCARFPSSGRSRGAVYFPAKLSGLYQAAQNMTLNHFTTTCQNIPEPLRNEIFRLKSRKSYVLGGGKGYWARGGQIRNLVEIEERLFFRTQIPENIAFRTKPES